VLLAVCVIPIVEFVKIFMRRQDAKSDN